LLRGWNFWPHRVDTLAIMELVTGERREKKGIEVSIIPF
jgi:hypothetical protein